MDKNLMTLLEEMGIDEKTVLHALVEYLGKYEETDVKINEDDGLPSSKVDFDLAMKLLMNTSHCEYVIDSTLKMMEEANLSGMHDESVLYEQFCGLFLEIKDLKDNIKNLI